MKLVFAGLLFSFLFGSCAERSEDDRAASSGPDTIAAVQFPVVIDGGKKVVYQIGQMTPRGLKYFLDTVDVAQHEVALPDSIDRSWLSPLPLPGDEDDKPRCLLIVSVPGYWEETVFGKIDSAGNLCLNYKNRLLFLSPTRDLSFMPGQINAAFKSDFYEVNLSALLNKTLNDGELAGKGRIEILESRVVKETLELFVLASTGKEPAQ